MVLAIRPAQTRDAAALAEIYAPSVLHRPTSFELRAPEAPCVRCAWHDGAVEP